MTSTKYIGMDVHKESISIAVMNSVGKVVMECVIETKASMILQFIDGLRGDLQVTFEEGTSAAWLYNLLKPHVTKLVVCDPRKNKSMREGNQNDQIDARRLAELLRLDHLTPVYHDEHGLRTLKELVRSYLTVTKDLGRVMTRVKAIYRSWAIPCSGKQVYARRHRAEWLGKINEPGVRRRAEFYYQQLDALRVLRQEVRRDLLAESKKHKAWKRLCQIPSIGPIRAAVLLGILQTPHRFRTKRPLWNYSGLAIEMHSSADHRRVDGQLQRSRKNVLVRGLNRNCNHNLKNLFKGAAAVASSKPGPFQEFYRALVAKGMRPEMARLTENPQATAREDPSMERIRSKTLKLFVVSDDWRRSTPLSSTQSKQWWQSSWPRSGSEKVCTHKSLPREFSKDTSRNGAIHNHPVTCQAPCERICEERKSLVLRDSRKEQVMGNRDKRGREKKKAKKMGIKQLSTPAKPRPEYKPTSPPPPPPPPSQTDEATGE